MLCVEAIFYFQVFVYFSVDVVLCSIGQLHVYKRAFGVIYLQFSLTRRKEKKNDIYDLFPTPNQERLGLHGFIQSNKIHERLDSLHTKTITPQHMLLLHMSFC